MPSQKLSAAKKYTVKSGDTLYSIALAHDVSHQQLIAWNGLHTATIHVGQELSVKPPHGEVMPIVVADVNKEPEKVKAQQSSQRTKVTTGQIMGPIPDAPTKAVESLKWRWPVKGKVMQTFNASDPTRKGIKIRGEEGLTVRAAEGGTIVYSGDGLVGYGELIIIKHNNNYLSAYAYNRKRLVKEGDKVKRGAAIAEMGISGGEALLHFEIRRKGKPVNPLAYLP